MGMTTWPLAKLLGGCMFQPRPQLQLYLLFSFMFTKRRAIRAFRQYPFARYLWNSFPFLGKKSDTGNWVVVKATLDFRRNLPNKY